MADDLVDQTGQEPQFVIRPCTDEVPRILLKITAAGVVHVADETLDYIVNAIEYAVADKDGANSVADAALTWLRMVREAQTGPLDA